MLLGIRCKMCGIFNEYVEAMLTLGLLLIQVLLKYKLRLSIKEEINASNNCNRPGHTMVTGAVS